MTLVLALLCLGDDPAQPIAAKKELLFSDDFQGPEPA